ncbi:OmpA family protein [Flavobacterium sp. W1B]|uniref:OmpA family protein n=1 Tax=Flavobacterium sp. W1B TaxID=3394146 RepID=UPI0039BC8863
MKKILLILIVFSIQLINAQNQDLKRANRFFDRTYYNEAIPLYETIVREKSSAAIIKNLADSYYYTNDFAKAQRYYKRLIDNYDKDLGEEYYFRYSQTLKATGNYKEANSVMKNYFSLLADKQALTNFEKGLLTLENVSAIGKRFEIKNLAINTSNSEFGTVPEGGSLVFSGVKKKAGLFDKMYKWNGETYLNLMSIPLKNINSGDSIVNYFSKEINTSMHESNAVFTKDGKIVYFTRNNYKKGRRGRNKDKVSNLQIFRAEFVDNKWTNIVSLPFNSDDYSTEHPALSTDEKTLYFASDMPGTLGSFDIFSVSINGDAYGSPKNLGNQINTSRKEQFPFISKDNKLYFSSNGHEGYGSLDVFVSQLKNGVFSKPENVGLPLNSGYDDFAFYIDSESNEGYFSSNRLGGKGSDDIYSLKEVKALLIEDCKQFISGIISDVDTKLPLENAVVILQNSGAIEIQRISTSADGKFNFTVSCETAYKINASKENYDNNSKAVTLNKERDKINDASMELKSMEAIKREKQLLFDEQNKAKLAAIEFKKKEAILAEEQKKKELVIAAKRDKDLAVAKKKELEITAKINKDLAEAKKKEKTEAIIANEKDVVKEKDRLLIKTDPIYFDYNLWYIRKESKPILNRVIELMKKYPEMVVEIGSHTDNRGNSKFNMDLSTKRAQSTRTYFVEQGIPAGRIFAKGYGETVQIVKCVPEDSCSEEQHELNRRSEFVIKSL